MTPFIASLDQRINRLNGQQPLPVETRRFLAEALRTRITYASNAIEGNHLTLAETQMVLSGVAVGGKPLRDHLEAIDHAEAWDAMIQAVNSPEPITSFLLRSLHGLVLRRSQPEYAGQYRQGPVAIAGSPRVPPDPIMVPSAVDELLTTSQHMDAHPVVAGAIMHARLMRIHPFVDGNGRTGRLLLNLWLLRHHYVPTILEPDDRPAYYAALQAADGGLFEPIIKVVAHGISRTLSLYEEVLHLGPEPPASRPPGLHL
ncbi:Fic family protein [Sulfobacillus thermosulfidooxidans]|uniref:Fic family protein n=1 Tax=Sulfobacillus thermosulfidooxidans TaxID=28034 RepID=UPI0006B50057|nr:Fic family protein [Sulfobacillus thermosulfidooxidans]